MPDRWTAAKVGALVVALAAATWIAYRVVDENAGRQGYRLWTLFDSAQGLVPKSRVVIAGIPVGYIASIRLAGDKARVDLHIDRDVAIHQDARIGKRTASILGEAMLVIQPGSQGLPRMKDGDRILLATETAGTDEVLNNVNEIARSIRLVAKQLEHAFGSDEAGRQMASVLGNLTNTLEVINRTIRDNEGNINSTVSNVAEIAENAAPKLALILDNIAKTTSDVRDLIGNNREGLNNATGRVDDTVASIQRASKELEAVLGDIRQVTQRTAKGEGTVGRLTKDEALIDEVQGVVQGVGSVVGGISRLQTIVELRSEYNVLANSFKTYVSLRLQTREDSYFLFQFIDDPRGVTEKIQSTVITSPAPDGTPPYYQENRTVTRNKFLFSAMFAKRIRFATFRFGILESTGGIGMDLHMLDDRLEINNDIFSLGVQAFPRLRVRIAYEIVRRLWLVAGADDVVNGTRDVFAGAMLRFNDEDLKSILPFVGVSSVGGGR